MKHTKIKFEKVLPTKDQVDNLFELLKNRDNSISHDELPPYEEHKEFVENHPYRAWFILTKKDSILGTFYLTNENSVGINFVSQFYDGDVEAIFQYLQRNYRPLAEIKSVRRGDFFINVSQKNKKLIDSLERLKKVRLQATYLI